jgi:ABC-type glycerol-3-phosphate transport system permease component
MADATRASIGSINNQSSRRFKVVVYALLIAVAVVYVAPFAFMVGKSVQNTFEANNTANIIPQNGVNLGNYLEVWNGSTDAKPFGRYLWVTIVLEILGVSGQTVICVLGAYAFARIRFPGRDMLFGLLLMTLFVPSIIVLIPNLIIITNIDRLSERIHPSLTWLGNWPALVIPFWANTFSVFLLRQFFLQIPEDLWDAARMDGAGHMRFLVSVVIPISGAAVMTTVLFAFVGIWSALEWPILVGSEEWRPIAVGLQAFRQEGGTKVNLLMAASVVALMPILLLYLLTQKRFTQGISTTGLK